MVKSQLDGWMDKIYKKNRDYSVSTQTKTTPEHAADVRYHLDCWLVQACLRGAFVSTITTFLVCCKCIRQHRWLDIAITNMYASASDMHACRHNFAE